MRKTIGWIQGLEITLKLKSFSPVTLNLEGADKTAIMALTYELEIAGFEGEQAKIDSRYFMASLLEMIGERIRVASLFQATGLVGSWEIDLTKTRVVSEVPGSMRLEVALRSTSVPVSRGMPSL